MFRSLIKPDQKDWVQRCPMIEFTINLRIGSTTRLAPFEINCGYMPTMMREVKASERTPPGIWTLTQDALWNMILAHDALIEMKILVDDLIYLSTKNIKMPKGRASKSVPKFMGPYKVLKVISTTSNSWAGTPTWTFQEADSSQISCRPIKTTLP